MLDGLVTSTSLEPVLKILLQPTAPPGFGPLKPWSCFKDLSALAKLCQALKLYPEALGQLYKQIQQLLLAPEGWRRKRKQQEGLGSCGQGRQDSAQCSGERRGFGWRRAGRRFNAGGRALRVIDHITAAASARAAAAAAAEGAFWNSTGAFTRSSDALVWPSSQGGACACHGGQL